ncbi:nucleotide-diphospho-sugar transferase [Stereum hirsutum FP-91666 SS1]|uniref:nucleotide-diphospho-sugar transferase n=1 Tax=Stereum hirsutum (strain FP-91666) TaxID=721885 RepID=UPI000444973F|nr:nucleotide-diphospho-sugar transferase [Stereum hirsutum FP-91666 SS1]EIM82724.1 nucleotide-diphospho-sugar transferase [Stereum hirsutum FP-91666 SS1]
MSSNTSTNDPPYDFTPTQDWFSFNTTTWKSLFPYITTQSPRVLEIGSWEGRSAVFLLTELCKSLGEIVCIDHFDLHRTDAGRERYQTLNRNLSLTGKKFRIIDEFSVPGLMKVLRDEISLTEPGFDWIYVDGSHEADDTFLDGELAWRLARKGAIFIFDDYDWDAEPKESRHHPKRGIDAFLALHAGEYKLLSGEGQYQMILQKPTEMRIGFLLKDEEQETAENEGARMKLEKGLGWGMYVAYCVDPTYAMPAAVSIRSLAKNTPGRITVYIVSFGLTEADKEAIRNSIPLRDDLTILFLEPSEESFVRETGMGPLWGKLALADIIPAERVLYLDADTLVRGDITPLWATGLGNNTVAATADVGFPMGYDEKKKKRYFNAGVLVMDLVKIRARSSEVERACREGSTRRYKDQDVVNDLFTSCDGILELSLRWNAQGLGTYATFASPERQSLDLSAMINDPVVVHFTGPLHPRMEEVLHPWVQPFVAKPWGYAGAPGHPYAEEWWEALDETAWKGWRVSEQRKSIGQEAINKAKQVATARFEEIIDG